MVLKPKYVGQAVGQAVINIIKVDFDDVADASVIDNHYASKGVTFASVTNNPPGQGSAFARKNVNAITQPNIVSVNQSGFGEFDASEGGIQATFQKPQRFVGITVRATVLDEIIGRFQWPTARPFLEFWDNNGNFMQATQFYPFFFGDPNWGNPQQLSFVATSAEIGKVVFSCEISSPHRVLALFDHLVFSEYLPYSPQVPIRLGGGS
jgi:hypothetical protein